MFLCMPCLRGGENPAIEVGVVHPALHMSDEAVLAAGAILPNKPDLDVRRNLPFTRATFPSFAIVNVGEDENFVCFCDPANGRPSHTGFGPAEGIARIG